MAGPSVRFACRCGALTGRLTDIRPSEGTHLVCHCDDCARAARYFDADTRTDQGIALWQTTPDRIQIDTGAEHLRLMRLSPRGLFRWYAGCCNTPIANTLTTPWLPFAGLMVDRLDDPAPLGPVICESFVPVPGGRPTNRNAVVMAWRIFLRGIGARLAGLAQKTPFFTWPDKQPAAAPELAPKDAGRAR